MLNLLQAPSMHVSIFWASNEPTQYPIPAPLPQREGADPDNELDSKDNKKEDTTPQQTKHFLAGAQKRGAMIKNLAMTKTLPKTKDRVATTM